MKLLKHNLWLYALILLAAAVALFFFFWAPQSASAEHLQDAGGIEQVIAGNTLIDEDQDWATGRWASFELLLQQRVTEYMGPGPTTSFINKGTFTITNNNDKRLFLSQSIYSSVPQSTPTSELFYMIIDPNVQHESSTALPQTVVDEPRGGEGLVPDCGYVGNPCGFDDFFALIHNIVEFLIQLLTPILVVFMISAGGFMIMTSAGDAGRYKRGKDFIKWALIGYAVILSAWLVINAILTGIGVVKPGTFTDWFNPTS